jgi:hypothetical protein
MLGREHVESAFDNWDICTENVESEDSGISQRVVLRSIPRPKRARREL